MSNVLPSCPYLPPCREGLDYRELNRFEKGDRGPHFYFGCLEYAQSLWQRGFAARAILCLDRALGADLSGSEPILGEWPLPYAAMGWLLAHVPAELYVGNPRVHFQHYADRMNEPRKLQRAARAWACWALVRVLMPDLPDDPRHEVAEPSLATIAEALRLHGIAGEELLWSRTHDDAVAGVFG